MAGTGSFTNFASQKYLDHVFGGNSKSSHTPHFSLFVTTPTPNGPGSEPSGGNYNRVATDATYFAPSITGEVISVLDIVFPRATANWGSIVGVGLHDSSVAGNCLAFWHAEDVEIITDRDRLIILAGGLIHRFISGFYSNYLKNAILNDCYCLVPLPVWPTLYGAYYTSAPTATMGGTEPITGAYSRIPVANSGVNFSPWSGGQKVNIAPLEFPEATADQGTINHFGWHDAASGGQFLAGGPLAPAKTILTNDQYVLNPGDIIHTLI